MNLAPQAPTSPGIRNSPDTGGLDIASLETVYDRLALAIDQAGPEKASLLLTKLALVQAQALGDLEQFLRHIEAAQRDL